MPVPRYLDYETYQSTLTGDIERGVDSLLEDSKISFQKAMQRIKNLIGLEESQRNTLYYPTELLTDMQKVIVRNSLLTAKIKLMGQNITQVVIDWPNCKTHFPALELK